jgi:SsrA-binding protein
MTIVDNKKAFFDYFIEDRYEAGLMLEGWEVKAIRAGRAQIKEGYVVLQNGAFMLIGAHISPLTSASTHVNADPVRTRKLLLRQEEINKLIGKVEQRGYTLVPLNLHYKSGRIKLEIGLAKGKKQHDKRDTEKERDTKREVQQAMKKAVQ